MAKGKWIQIRVSDKEHQELKRLAGEKTISAYMLEKALADHVLTDDGAFYVRAKEQLSRPKQQRAEKQIGSREQPKMNEILTSLRAQTDERVSKPKEKTLATGTGAATSRYGKYHDPNYDPVTGYNEPEWRPND